MENNIKCEACGAFFIQTRSTQKYCPTCREAGSTNIKIKYERQESIGLSHIKELTEEPYILTCEVCGKVFKSIYKERKTCSYSCDITKRKNELKCNYCGEYIIKIRDIPDEELKRTRHYCNDKCEKKFKEKVKLKNYPDKYCINCGKQYYNKNEKFCSNECFVEFSRKQSKKKKNKIHICTVCKQEFYEHRYALNTGKKLISVCSRACLDKLKAYYIRKIQEYNLNSKAK